MSNSDKTVIPRISVLSGGVGAEREVSLQSGQSLADALEELKDHNFMKIHESAWKFMYYNLLRGLAIGLGSVVGATVLVTIFIQILAQFEFIPIIGNWAHEVIEIIEKLDKSE